MDMDRMRGCVRLAAALVLVMVLGPAGWAQPVDESGPKTPTVVQDQPSGQPGRFLERVELYSTYVATDRRLSFNTLTGMGMLPVRVDSDLYEATGGLRVFSTQLPLPLLDVSYRGTGEDSDVTYFTPAPVTFPYDDRDHAFRLGFMLPVPNVGLFKAGASDTEASSAYGLYAVPRVGPASFKFGFEWSENEGTPDDRLYFGIGTLPYGDWEFTVGASDRLLGDTMAGAQIGRWFAFKTWFAGAGLYWVENHNPAFAVMAGRVATEGQWGPSFWIVHLNNYAFRQTNVQIALGKPGVPKEALNNPYMNGIYTGMYTDQMGVVAPIPVRNFEEMRIWKRADEYAQEGEGGWGGLAMSFNAMSTNTDYKIIQSGIFYTHPRLGPLLYPHLGPVVESERLPDIGWQDWRVGLEFGTYLIDRTPTPFYRAGRLYFGVRGMSDFDDYSSIMGEFRINL